MMKRAIYQNVWNELIQQKSMIFLSGPRQSGKTTFAHQLQTSFLNSLYFNRDSINGRRVLIEDPLFFAKMNRKDPSIPLVIFDEIHKQKGWKNYLKGIYDDYAEAYKFLVLGSGRLNVFQKGSDSLAGRYFTLNFWPFTLSELIDDPCSFETFRKNPYMFTPRPSSGKLWEQLSTLSGFPEPFLSGQETRYRQWANSYYQQIIREDIRSLAEVKNVDLIETLYSLLPSRVGSPLAIDRLAQDLQVSFKSVKSWLDLAERTYLFFRISPWTKKISRAISRQKKLYLMDYVAIDDPSYRFENMVAVELMRAVTQWNDRGWGTFELCYIRNKEKEEVDFLILDRTKPFLLIETKLSNENPDDSLFKFQGKLNIPAIQLVNKKNIYKIIPNESQQILVATASDWLGSLP